MYGCENLSLRLRIERTLKAFENRILGQMFGNKREEVTGGKDDYTRRSFKLCTPHQVLFKRSKRGGKDREGMWKARENRYGSVALVW